MQLPEQFKEYAQLVTHQLRWKKARPVIEREITTHLCDQRDALVGCGMDEDAAVDESIRQMGDAVEIGTGLDRVHRPKPSWSLLILTGVLLLIGLAIKTFLTYDGDYPHELPTMLLAAVLGIGCLMGAYFADFTILGKRPLLIYAGAVVLVLCMMLPVFPVVNSRSYYAVQVSLILPVAFAALLYGLRGKRWFGFLLALAGLMAACACCMIIPAMSTALPMAVSGVVLLSVVVWGDWFKLGKRLGCIILAICVLLGITWFVWRISCSAYMMQRIEIALRPELEPSGRGWGALLIREVLSGAQMLGRGTLGEYSLSAPLFLDDADLLLTYLIHRVGWISLIVIMAVFTAFFAIAIHKCIKQKNMLGRMVSLAVILTLAAQVVIYVVYDLGICFISGIALPLVSYGNVALIIDMALIGIMLSVFRTGSLVHDENLPVHRKTAWNDHVRWHDGELTISFKKKMVS